MPLPPAAAPAAGPMRRLAAAARPSARRLAPGPSPPSRRLLSASAAPSPRATAPPPTPAPRPWLLRPAQTKPAARAFSTTPPARSKTIKPHGLPSHLVPPYPHGERALYKQSNRGLYGAARIRFGNSVAPRHSTKSARFWRPNVHVKIFWSPSLGARVKTRLTMRVLKTIRREGGIEQYLLKPRPARVRELGPAGWALRWLLSQTRAVQERLNAERVALGLRPRPVEDRDSVIQYALDCATPGPLSARSRATRGALRAADDAFLLGYDPGREPPSAADRLKELLPDELPEEEEEDGEPARRAVGQKKKGAKRGTKPGAKASTEASTRTGTKTSTKTPIKASTNTGTKAGTKASTKAGTKAKAGTKGGTKTGAKASTKAGTKAGTRSIKA